MAVAPVIEVTSLMFRRLPRKLTSQELLSEIHEVVGARSVDFLHVPRGRRQSTNVGFAFVNFVDAEAARVVQETMNGRHIVSGAERRALTVIAAEVQG